MNVTNARRVLCALTGAPFSILYAQHIVFASFMSPLLPLLALIAHSDAYGYELKRIADSEFAPHWKIDFAQLYRSLAKLRAAGLVRAREIGRAGGPERKQYTITPRGRAALAAWLREPATTHEEFWVKTRLAARLGWDTHALVDAERARMARTATASPGAVRQTPLNIASYDDTLPLRIAGSDDLLLARLAQDAHALFYVNGSTAGLFALASQQADVVGAHLREPDTNEFNISFVKHLVAEQDVLVVNLAAREYGLLVAHDNPKGIRDVRTLTQRGVSLMNRTQGSGARLWLQRHVRALHLDPLTLRGWSRAVPTYEAVARAILEDAADVGPGLRATAEQFGLDFVPLGKERFDFVIARSVFESKRGRALQEILHSKTFREYARTLSGYDVSRTGRVMAEIRFGTQRKG